MTKKINKAMVLVNTLVFGTVAIVMVSALVNWSTTVLHSAKSIANKEQAMQIAEAGIEYYRWHLAHASTDYWDGQGATSTGPYVHEYRDRDDNLLGHFSLTITPPPVGSTKVLINSVGTIESDTSIERTIKVMLAIPSLAKYSVASNEFVRFGEGTEVFGPIHSNNGIRFDGLAHNLISSSKDKFIDPDRADGIYRFGVYTTVSPQDPNPPASVPNRPDVFESGRQFPLPTYDFGGLTSDLASLKTAAQAGGRYFTPSGRLGYQIILKTNDTFDLYQVRTLTSPSNNCRNNSTSLEQIDWGSWTISNRTFLANYPIPNNGIIFLEDDVWVEGTINTARVTIVAAVLPQNPSDLKHITVNNNLRYTNYDGRDVIGLIAQGNINAGLSSLDTLYIEGALVSQNGRVGRYYYSSSCGTGYYRSELNLYGMIASNKRYGFAYTDGTGYDVRNITYDPNLLYGPPPSFPLTSDQYSILSWEEII